MTSDPSSIEAQLRELQAAALDEAYLLRLEAAADGSLTRLTPGELHFEAMLRETPPARLSADFLARLEASVHDVPFAVDEKIVPFPQSSAPEPRRQRPIWSAAAAVALIGAASALLVPSANLPSPVARQSAPPSPSSSIAATPAGNFIPAGFNRGLSEVRDEGIVWKSNKQPHNVVRVVYKDKITLKDANGRTVEVEQPRVEYMLVPAKTD